MQRRPVTKIWPKSSLGGKAMLTALVFLLAVGLTSLQAYPEYQRFVVSHSKRPINCAMCHAHPDGPDGTAPGQVGRLTASELERLGRARAAFEPGAKVDSPILNAFGNHIINSIGKKKVLEIKVLPEKLAEVLPSASDLDHDGIPDAQEFLAGTHPLIASDGNPWRLFIHNFWEKLPQILLTLSATIIGLYGFYHLLLGFSAATRLKEEEEESIH